MIIEIALGIVLAVIILRLLPLLIAAGIVVGLVGLVLIIIGIVAVWAFRNPGDLATIFVLIGVLASLPLIGNLFDKAAERWPYRVTIGEIFGLLLVAIFSLVLVAMGVAGIVEYGTPGWLDKVLFSLIALGIMSGLVALLIQHIRARPMKVRVRAAAGGTSSAVTEAAKTTE
jgi:hypothetical protein